MNIGVQHTFDNTVLIYAGENELELIVGDNVIFSHGEKKECAGKVTFLDKKKLTTEVPLDGKILRKVSKDDLKKIKKLNQEAKRALEKCCQKSAELGINMQVFEATYAFDESELNFQFTAVERVDFRILVPILAGLFKKRIHLQQVGPRDRAKLLGGFGSCGRPYCCTGALQKFKSVTLDMARAQELVMKGTDKLSGPCGKLLCCLSYEVEEYERLRKDMPSYGSFVETLKGPAKIIGLDILNQQVKVWLDSGGVLIAPVKDIKSLKAKRTVTKKTS